MPMSAEELKAAIESTKLEIHRLKDKLEKTTDPQEVRRLKKELKALRYKQFWHLSQVG